MRNGIDEYHTGRAQTVARCRGAVFESSVRGFTVGGMRLFDSDDRRDYNDAAWGVRPGSQDPNWPSNGLRPVIRC